jgi:hypothetical protein
MQLALDFGFGVARIPVELSEVDEHRVEQVDVGARLGV